MIKRFTIKNFKALRDVTIDLTPFHVLIGPNDAGKTTLLEALAALCRSVDHKLTAAFTGRWTGRELVWRNSRDAAVEFKAVLKDGAGEIAYQLQIDFHLQSRSAVVSHEQV